MLALYLFYYVMLRSQPGIRLNRLYLLIAPAIAMVLPLLQWPPLLSHDIFIAESLQAFQLREVEITAYQNETATAAMKSYITFPSAVLFTYCIGTIVLLGKLVSQLMRIRKLVIQSTALPSEAPDTVLLQTDSSHPTFTFLHYIFVGEQSYLTAQEKKQVLVHEMAHAKLHHTWDILYYEILSALLWFNPMVWLLKNELRDVHEYQADAEVLAQHQPQQYSALLAKEVLYKTGIPVGSYFKEPQVFKRMQMLQRYGKRTNLLRPLAMLPLLLLSLLFSSQGVSADIAAGLSALPQEAAPEQEVNIATTTEPAKFVSEDSKVKFVPPAIVEEKRKPGTGNNITPSAKNVEASSPQEKADETLDTSKVYEYVEQMPFFHGGEKAMLQFLGENIKYPKAAIEAKTEGIVVLSFVVQKDGMLTDINIIRDLGNGTAEEAVRVTKLMQGKWQAGRQNGIALPVRYTLPVRFTIK